MNKWNLFWLNVVAACCLILTSSCSKLLKWTPASPSDSGDVEITCDAREGNQGLIDYRGDVYVHVGLITSKSENNDDWRFVKFKWGSKDIKARATPAGKNKWTYTIKNIRKFFNVNKDEQIINLAILFRSGACIDIYCKVLRNTDGSNMYIPINDKTEIVRSASVAR